MTRALAPVLAIAALVVVVTGGCRREQRRSEELAPFSSLPMSAHAPDTAFDVNAPGDADREPYESNAWAVNEGSRLFVWFNCAGCHSQGGGGMGPALMDGKWRYGSRPADIYRTIVEGRPNGMPSFRGRIPEQQIWQLVAYVRSLSGLERLDVRPGRNEVLHPQAPPAMRERREPRHEP